MEDHTTTDPLETLRRHVLEGMEGPAWRTVHDIPRRWPVVRLHLEAMIGILTDEGLLERGAPRPGHAGTPRFRLSAEGRRELAALRGGRSGSTPPLHPHPRRPLPRHRAAHVVARRPERP